MRMIDKYRPETLVNIVGNKKTIDRILRAIIDNNGFDGLVFMLTGKTGNGKTLVADLIAKKTGGTVYRPDCTKDADTAVMIDQIKRDIVQISFLSHYAVYIFDEADKLHPDNIAKLKTTIDTIDRRRQADLPCNVAIIFTSAKTKEQLTPTQRHHWDELYTRCIPCKIDILPEEMDAYFADITGGRIKNISRRLAVYSMRAAWEFIESKKIPLAY